MEDKVILVDCDGVLLDWIYAFDSWMKRKGYILHNSAEYDCTTRYGFSDRMKMRHFVRSFNESANIGFLTPFRDSVYYVNKLYENHGYVFHCITSLSNDPYAQKLRENNLKNVFGKNIFEKIICLDCGADKDGALEKYRGSGCFWIEDKVENAIVGSELGLKSIIMNHPHNRCTSFNEPIVRVNNWKEIYNTIVHRDIIYV